MNEEIDNNCDNHVDDEVYECLNLDTPKSFFLFAGAGAGKTRTLVNVLNKVKENYGQRLHLSNKKIAVITYTNNACEEIRHRLGNDALFKVSTIHSYIWDLIKHYNEDIKEWIRIKITNDLVELREKQASGRTGKAQQERARKIIKKTQKLEGLDNIKKFTYNPNGDNYTRQSLNHSQVIGIGADFLKTKPLMQKIMVTSNPILLIDESQDTVKELVDAFLIVQKENRSAFCLGLLGDTMQRIYSSGKEGLEKNLPKDWVTPSKKMNHRSSKRIVDLINRIRKEVDTNQQKPRTDKGKGHINLFLVSDKSTDKLFIESQIAKKMAKITNDDLWSGNNSNIQTLAIEHQMIARRNNFLQLFEPLYKIEKFKSGLLDGTLSQLRLFTEYILPLIEALKNKDKFKVSQIVRRNSPLMKPDNLKLKKKQIQVLKKVNEAVIDLFNLWNNGNDPTLLDVLKKVSTLKLFTIPDSLQELIKESDNETENKALEALKASLNTPFSQIKSYKEYVIGESKFETHQGVKGLEYPRVMVIIDDSEAKGFMFSYDKLFGVKKLSDNDKNNIKNGKETSIDRTRRLFYVACSRAQNSLAIVVYTDSPKLIRESVIKKEWFVDNEIEIIS
ncbi:MULTISPECIES: UvrD-helicase domain-containing protein [unclassified Tenacibaculum]|uniref:UvrD-helicase domain-containing protein n=1 Tax=unclassified Tenacibaculum TaxID=2635139 RepID=UPI001F4476A3|nr:MULTISPECIES: UvrD-helicase domain-containing protein [unclassified Tenacibaculum]MCF2873820.1 AAA family ATPase [Tenacibaculum sp. Cn5-1]MCF2933976.1 AAA family ATPase [Tenacibaculum sp. Cn5-34]MCG7509442.1 AAA family ATPase [Tenacibaculum sp. Cn5-46]